jgi:hypothetical protein
MQHKQWWMCRHWHTEESAVWPPTFRNILEMHSLQYRLVSIFLYLTFLTVVPPEINSWCIMPFKLKKIFQYNFPCLEILISWPLVAPAISVFRIIFVMYCTGNATFNRLWISQTNSRSVIAALMSLPFTLLWSGHYSYISICDIISWQMKCINQILTEDCMQPLN